MRRGRTNGKGSLATLLAVGAVTALFLPAGASAATTLGSDLAETPSLALCSPGGSCTYTDVAHPGQSFAASADGVITGWRIRYLSTAPSASISLGVIRPADAAKSTGISASTTQTVPPVAVPTVTPVFPTRQAIKANDLIALNVPSGANLITVLSAPQTGVTRHLWDPVLGVGETRLPTFINFDSSEVLVQASLEADADHDGFGDETQDCAPANPAKQTGCTVTRKCKRKHKKHRHASSAKKKKKKCKKKGRKK